jgi:predicted nuclease of predicted toxin-antitoxin system
VSRLFIELYLDEDVSVLIAHLLRARGFVIVTTQEAGKLGANDREQLEFATGRRMTLLTHNDRDFEDWPNAILRRAKPMPESLWRHVIHRGRSLRGCSLFSIR